MKNQNYLITPCSYLLAQIYFRLSPWKSDNALLWSSLVMTLGVQSCIPGLLVASLGVASCIKLMVSCNNFIQPCPYSNSQLTYDNP